MQNTNYVIINLFLSNLSLQHTFNSNLNLQILIQTYTDLIHFNPLKYQRMRFILELGFNKMES